METYRHCEERSDEAIQAPLPIARRHALPPQLRRTIPRAYPRPMNGIRVAITVMNWTLAESGRPAM